MITNLKQYINILKDSNELIEINAVVDPYLELAEIHRRVIAANGPALLFKNVKGSQFPVATNLFGSAKRIELSFGPKPSQIISQIAKLPVEMMPPSPSKIWAKKNLFFDLAKVGLKNKSSGAICDNIVDPDLNKLPLLTTWPKDGGAFITLPLVYTQHPENSSHNLGMYRIQRYDHNTTGLHMQIGKGGGFHLSLAKELNQKLPVNIIIGGPPALILSAIAPLPENVPELLLASLIQGQKLEITKTIYSQLPIPAQAEFCLIGEVDPNETRPEGPFGDHYGYYSLTHDYPVFRCKKMLYANDAIYPATVVGKPRQEDFYLGDYLQELLSPLFPLVMPAVHDLWSYGETGYHSLSAAVVAQRYKREALASGFRILGEGQLSLTKFLLLLDKKLDLKDFRSVLTYVLERADFRTDLYIFANLSMDSLDYAGPKINQGSKGILLGSGDPIRALPKEFPKGLNDNLPSYLKQVEVFSAGCLVVSGEQFSTNKNLAQQIAKDPIFKDWPLIVLVDDAKKAAKSSINFLWTTFTRFDPASDIHSKDCQIISNHPSHTPPIVIDSRMKPWYPEELFCDDQTSKLVTKRWKEYFPNGMEMGSSDLGHLD